jgi:bifunctional UDP-N-acetylglucosamine pyrophosphorylase/glucosamine-1-phosphate N-acetyltransferase
MLREGSAVILAAGQGTRMKSARPKVLHRICGRPMLGYVLDAALRLEPERIQVVVGHGADEVRRDPSIYMCAPAARLEQRLAWVEQVPQRGTGHALQCCLPEVARGAGPVLVLYGDMPLVEQASLDALIALWRDRTQQRGVALLTASVDAPRGFGRVVREAGAVRAIVEERDATPEVLALREVNLGVYVFAPRFLAEELPQLAADNAQGELYLTDLVRAAVRRGLPVEALQVDDARQAIGVNTLAHLSEARAAIQARILAAHLAAGVEIEDPATTYVDFGVTIGAGTRILPCTVIRSGVRIGAGCEIGPFTHLRAGTRLDDGVEVGNFTEAKQARLGRRTKAKHLAYLGDVEIGAEVNVGAGTIVANFDGRRKHASRVGDRAFIGSGTVLVSPVDVGAGALTGAGAVVKRNSVLPPGTRWVGVPARQIGPGRGGSDPRPGSGAPPDPHGGGAA